MLLGKTLGEPFVSFKQQPVLRPRGRRRLGPRTDEPIQPYTTAETMDAGWCWQIEHEHRINRGYVYCSAFISDEDAEREFRRKNPKVGPTRIVKFVSGRYERAWVKNVVAIGNACGFVEPLEATSLAVICDECDSLVNSYDDCDFQPTSTIRREFNKRAALVGRHPSVPRCHPVQHGVRHRVLARMPRECRARCRRANLVEYFAETARACRIGTLCCTRCVSLVWRLGAC